MGTVGETSMTMVNTGSCCGCHVEDDYGTSFVSGTGESTDPYSIEQELNDAILFKRPVVKTTLQVDRSVPLNTPTAIQWTGVQFDTHNMFSLVNPTRVVIPITGLYLMGYQVVWNAPGDYKTHEFVLNGTTTLDSHTKLDSGVFNANQTGYYQWYFSENDYVELVLTADANKSIIGRLENDAFRRGFSGLWMMYLGKRI